MSLPSGTEVSVHVRVGNDAMQTPQEIADAIRQAADMIEGEFKQGQLLDSNGAACGYFTTRSDLE